MKPQFIFGLVLIAAGAVGLSIANVSLTERKTVLEAGPTNITQDREKVIPTPTVVGVIAVVAGAGLLFFGRGRPKLDGPLQGPGKADVVLGEPVENDLNSARLHHPFQAMVAVLAPDRP